MDGGEEPILPCAKVYLLYDKGKRENQGSGPVIVNFEQRTISVFEEDGVELLCRPISCAFIYEKEDTQISWEDSDYKSHLALVFPEMTGCSFIWEQICGVQRSLQSKSPGPSCNSEMAAQENSPSSGKRTLMDALNERSSPTSSTSTSSTSTSSSGEVSLMDGGEEPILPCAKVYLLYDKGKRENQGSGPVIVNFEQRTISVFEEDGVELLCRPISCAFIYEKEDTQISWEDSDYKSHLALVFPEMTGCSFIWEQICGVQRSLQSKSPGPSCNSEMAAQENSPSSGKRTLMDALNERSSPTSSTSTSSTSTSSSGEVSSKVNGHWSDDIKDYLRSRFRYLEMFTDENDPCIEEGKEEAVRVIIQILNNPDTFECPWTVQDSSAGRRVQDFVVVQLLGKDERFEGLFQLFKIFLNQEVHAFLEFYTEHSNVLTEHGIDYNSFLEKMRVLSLVEACDLAEPSLPCRSYALISDCLLIQEDEVDAYVIMAKNADLLDCEICVESSDDKYIRVRRCKDRMVDISEWPDIRTKEVDWVKKFPYLANEVTSQENIACWAHASAKAVGNLCGIEHGSPQIAATQELIDRVILAYPSLLKEDDFVEDPKTRTYGAQFTRGLDLFVEYGVGLEKNYPYKIIRDVKKSFPPNRNEYPRLFIRGYEHLGRVTESEKHMQKVFKASHRGPLVGNITVSQKFAKLRSEYYEPGSEGTSSDDMKWKEEMMRRNGGLPSFVHSVLIYGSDLKARILKIINSWGPTWGAQGRANVPCEELYDIVRPYSSYMVETPKEEQEHPTEPLKELQIPTRQSEHLSTSKVTLP